MKPTFLDIGPKLNEILIKGAGPALGITFLYIIGAKRSYA